MMLSDLRRLSILKQMQIRFRMRNGTECVITEHGVAQAPALKSIPDFNLEEELTFAHEFLLDPVAPSDKKQADKKNAPRPRKVGREELSKMLSPASAAAHAEHDDE